MVDNEYMLDTGFFSKKFTKKPVDDIQAQVKDVLENEIEEPRSFNSFTSIGVKEHSSDDNNELINTQTPATYKDLTGSCSRLSIGLDSFTASAKSTFDTSSQGQASA